MTRVNQNHQHIQLYDLEKSAMAEDSIGLSSYPAQQHPGQEIRMQGLDHKGSHKKLSCMKRMTVTP
jgi:hypothetical protein